MFWKSVTLLIFMGLLLWIIFFLPIVIVSKQNAKIERLEARADSCMVFCNELAEELCYISPLTGVDLSVNTDTTWVEPLPGRP